MAKYFSIKNHLATCAEEVSAPWAIESKAPYDIDKADFVRWEKDPATDHYFLSMVEGTIAGLRTDYSANPPWLLHGIMVDYDGKLMKDPAEHVRTKPACEFLPQFLVVTKSLKGRLVWEFERPLRLYSADHYTKLMKHIFIAMKLDRWLPGLDGAYTNPAQYYEIGREWIPVSPEKKIPNTIVQYWDSQIFSKVQRIGDSTMRVKIPFEDLKKEVDSRFPGRWTGDFVTGARGPRFWDPAADNPAGIVVMEDGCRVYTPHDKPFMPWASIFGMDFVQRYEAEKLNGLPEQCAYDGKDFWVSPTIAMKNHWMKWGKEDFRKLMRDQGLSDKREKGALMSEADRVEMQILKQRRVDSCLPFLFMPQGIIRWNGSEYLNTTSAIPATPAAPMGVGNIRWADAKNEFPFIHRVLSRMFVDVKDAPEDKYASVDGEPTEQLEYLLSWMSHFYRGAHLRKPCPGQALVIAGPPSKGKTIFTQLILGQLMGGVFDGTPHLVDGDQWTVDIAQNPVIVVDDSTAANDLQAHKNFSARVKKYVANGSIRSNGKFQQTGMVPWFGRILILCNTDSESLRILPNVEMSNRDKMSFLRAGDCAVGYGTQEENHKEVMKELPTFARWLLDFEIPPYMMCPNRRFGTKAFMHPDLFQESATQGGEALFLEAWDKTIKELGEQARAPGFAFEGTAAELHELMMASAPAVMREMSHRSVGRVLSAMVSRGYDIRTGRNARRSRTYIVPGNLSAL